MRYLTLGGLGKTPTGVTKIASGVRWSTQNTAIPTGALFIERNTTLGIQNVYQYVRVSGTCTVGDLLYMTGNAGYVVKTASGVKPNGVSLVAPTASGDFTLMLVKGIHTSVQITATVAETGHTAALFGGIGSAAGNFSNYQAYYSALISGGTASATLFYIGRSLSVNTGSATLAYIDLM